MTGMYIFLCKAVGSVFVMCAVGYFAMNVNSMLEKRKRELRMLYGILIGLKSEIQYMCNPLPECFTKLADNQKEPFYDWLKSISEKMEEKKEGAFAGLWRQELQKLYEESALEQQDIEPLYELSDKLGRADIMVQLQAIDYALLHIERNRTVLESEMSQKKKIIATMSLFCGFMTLIILL